MTRELRIIQVTTKITPTMLRMLDLMVERGGHRTRGALLNKIIRDVLDDDARAHGEQPLPGDE